MKWLKDVFKEKPWKQKKWKNDIDRLKKWDVKKIIDDSLEEKIGAVKDKNPFGDGGPIKGTHTNKSKKLYVDENGSILGTIFLVVDPANIIEKEDDGTYLMREDGSYHRDSDQHISPLELDKYKDKMCEFISKKWDNGTTNTLLLNIVPIYDINQIKNPEQEVVITVGIDGEAATPETRENKDSYIEPNLRKGYFYYKTGHSDDKNLSPTPEGSSENASEAPHELGHLLGLADRYFNGFAFEAQGIENNYVEKPTRITVPSYFLKGYPYKNADGSSMKKNELIEEDYDPMNNIMSVDGSQITKRQLTIIHGKYIVENRYESIGIYKQHDNLKLNALYYSGNTEEIIAMQQISKIVKGKMVTWDVADKAFNAWWTENFIQIGNGASGVLGTNEEAKKFVIINKLW